MMIVMKSAGTAGTETESKVQVDEEKWLRPRRSSVQTFVLC